MTDERESSAADLPEDEELETDEVPNTVGPVEQATPGSGALGRPNLGANPFTG